MAIYDWNVDKTAIVEKLRIESDLKICVKVLDEPALIEDWVQHHEKIVGFKNLIIADNGSLNPEAINVLEKYSNILTVFRFNGPHNEIHWHPRFADFFEAVKHSSKYFSFIDADERLIWVDGNSWSADDLIPKKLAKSKDDFIVPTTWLINSLNSFETFTLCDTEGTPNFKNNLKWGKPILPSCLVGVQSGIHNNDFAKFNFSKQFGVKHFLLHYTQFPEGRIAVNRNKLISRGFVEKNTPIDDIVRTAIINHPDKSIPRFLNEIKKMLPFAEKNLIGGNEKNYIALGRDRKIRYSNSYTKIFFSGFCDSGIDLIELMFENDDSKNSHLKKSQDLLRYALEAKAQGLYSQAERIFMNGLALFPELLDQYGGPVFRKELLRMLLAKGDWDRAEELLPSPGDPGGVHWHQILFARAFTQIGESNKAALWWRLVLEQEPNNGEAKAHLLSQPGRS
jgi:tetratricopeptide (TPR) repeat protein